MNEVTGNKTYKSKKTVTTQMLGTEALCHQAKWTSNISSILDQSMQSKYANISAAQYIRDLNNNSHRIKYLLPGVQVNSGDIQLNNDQAQQKC